MGRQHESRRHAKDHVNIEIGRYPGRSSSKRHAHTSEPFYEDAAPTKGCCARLTRRKLVVITRILEFLFVAIDLAIVVARIVNPPVPAYPPNASGDHGSLPFILVAGALGFISLVIGGFSAGNCFNGRAEGGPKRNWFRYTSPVVDFVFAAVAGGGIGYAHTNMGNGGTQCYANMGTYQGCVMLMASMVMIGLGGAMAVVCAMTEVCLIRKWKKSSRGY